PGVFDAPMGNADVMPTLLDLAGVPVPPSVQGASYVPVLRGEKQRVAEGVLSCGWSKESRRYRHMSLHSDAWRLTWWPELGEGELYDLRSDPYELENVYHLDEYLPEREWLKEKLLHAYAAAGPLEPHVLCNW
ncbi:MAG TPA: DUF4976 domain-containing protein, partial [Candidatus Hydrogenedentes bacterium]|nr:DUF4976 domain-containing protein [Candidatus Hydrogenedentota bacterium]